jgi:hypothetical protein
VSRLVIDSSVVIKWFVPEVHSDDALRYLDPDLERNAPELLLAEVSNILWKKAGRSELTPAEANRIAEDVEQADVIIHPMRPLFGRVCALHWPAGGRLTIASNWPWPTPCPPRSSRPIAVFTTPCRVVPIVNLSSGSKMARNLETTRRTPTASAYLLGATRSVVPAFPERSPSPRGGACTRSKIPMDDPTGRLHEGVFREH